MRHGRCTSALSPRLTKAAEAVPRRSFGRDKVGATWGTSCSGSSRACPSIASRVLDRRTWATGHVQHERAHAL
eukprot:2127591-Pyramimonas_sp.AAC.1